MKIDLTEIYKGLKAWRHERDITLESQKKDYLVLDENTDKREFHLQGYIETK